MEVHFRLQGMPQEPEPALFLDTCYTRPCNPAGPCTQIGNTWALKYFLFRDFGAQVDKKMHMDPQGKILCSILSS